MAMSPRYLLNLALLVFLGCSYSAGTVVTLDTRTGEKKIIPHSSQFASKVKVEDIVYRETGNLIEAQIQLTNQSSKSVAVELKGKWYDESGFAVDDPKELWRHIIIAGKETKTVKLVSPRRNAVKLEVLTREGRFEDNY
jgi:uncharacterized protein YcfL